MQFTRKLHDPIRAGIITLSIRLWKRMHAKVGGRYRLGPGPGYVVVDSINNIGLDDITSDLAIESGFDSVEDLMKTARHGEGEEAYLIRFHYVDGDIDKL